jgi:hypothetical protein
MTHLTQQLEDKKKGCGRNRNTFICCMNEDDICRNDKYCCLCQAEIAILEQAIAEIKCKEEEFRELLNEEIGKNYQQGYEDCEKIAIAEMQKQRQEILDKIDKCYEELECSDEVYNRHILQAINYIHNEIKQLNQPKTAQ